MFLCADPLSPFLRLAFLIPNTQPFNIDFGRADTRTDRIRQGPVRPFIFLHTDMELKRFILSVDDDPDDISLLKDALQLINPNFELLEARDGADALEKLQAFKEQGQLPCLIVLDINMPRMDGRETFLAIRSDETLSQLPVVIFSTSSSKLDKLFFEKKDVEYITKPIRFEHLLNVARRLLQYCGAHPGQQPPGA